MTPLRRIASFAAAGLIAAGAVAAGSAPAQAKATANPPSCVNINVANFNHVIVTNNCTYAVKLKIIFSGAPDTNCFTLAGYGGKRDENRYNYPFGVYDKTITC